MATTKKAAAKQAEVRQETVWVLCYWCAGSGKVGARKCRHCKGSGAIDSRTPVPGKGNVTSLEDALAASVDTAASKRAAAKATAKPVGRGRTSSSSRAAKKRTKKAARKQPAKKATA